MTDTTTPDVFGVLLDKVTQLIKAQNTGEATGFPITDLNHVYLGLVEGAIDEKTDELLTKMVGPDWADGLEESEDDLDGEAKEAALVELLQQIDETDPQDAVNGLASALMVACRELRWLEASRAAHDQWFFAED